VSGYDAGLVYETTMKTVLSTLSVCVLALAPGIVQGQPTPFVPNDPHFPPNPTNTSYSQWYLNKTGTAATVDIRFLAVFSG
jgi:hypothetical protein